ncbi:phosphatase PAP2 family protein [Halovivax limisalsi]|uniref:phosphatase PAP2 family protein n=1 Tax=Halovivax limisalsi TaxID=1453760 RepID=UPI001FFD2966|nr:phosphatase PAP2 family protein [Halovivax limisalsi]
MRSAVETVLGRRSSGSQVLRRARRLKTAPVEPVRNSRRFDRRVGRPNRTVSRSNPGSTVRARRLTPRVGRLTLDGPTNCPGESDELARSWVTFTQMLRSVLTNLVLVVVGLIALVGSVLFSRSQLARTRRELLARLRDAAPIALVLGLVLVANGIVRQHMAGLSWIVGWELTWTFYQLEGGLVPWIQSFRTPALTAVFSYVYVYGYAFLLVFPVVAYLLLADTRPLRVLLTAYTINYTLGPLVYVFVIAYGPRNFAAESLLYDVYPQYQLLTAEVNRNTNVFPSLHVSLSVTVAVVAYWTRECYPAWWYLGALGSGCIAVATMYLGIHWAIDVAGGVVLAAISLWLADRLVDRRSLADRLRRRQQQSEE